MRSPRASILLLTCTAVTLTIALHATATAGPLDEARRTAARTDLAALRTALQAFEADVGRYPTTAEGLAALATQPAGAKKWRGPYVNRLPRDPWDNAYTYGHPGEKDPRSFDLRSSGPDGRDGTADDVSP